MKDFLSEIAEYKRLEAEIEAIKQRMGKDIYNYTQEVNYKIKTLRKEQERLKA